MKSVKIALLGLFMSTSSGLEAGAEKPDTNQDYKSHWASILAIKAAEAGVEEKFGKEIPEHEKSAIGKHFLQLGLELGLGECTTMSYQATPSEVDPETNIRESYSLRITQTFCHVSREEQARRYGDPAEGPPFEINNVNILDGAAIVPYPNVNINVDLTDLNKEIELVEGIWAPVGPEI